MAKTKTKTKTKKKLTADQKQVKREAKAERKKKYMWVFISGKQVRVKKPAMIDGIPVDEYILGNADSVWLHQNGLHEEAHAKENEDDNNFTLLGVEAKYALGGCPLSLFRENPGIHHPQPV